MQQAVFLVLAGLIYFAYSYLAFCEKFPKDSSTFFGLSMIVGFLYSLLWYWSARIIDDKYNYFFFVLLWDLVYISVFYFTPVLLFGVKLNWWGIVGLLTMIGGLFVMKIGH